MREVILALQDLHERFYDWLITDRRDLVIRDHFKLAVGVIVIFIMEYIILWFE